MVGRPAWVVYSDQTVSPATIVRTALPRICQPWKGVLLDLLADDSRRQTQVSSGASTVMSASAPISRVPLRKRSRRAGPMVNFRKTSAKGRRPE